MHGMLTTHKLTYIKLTLQVFTQHTQDISAYVTFFSVLITYMSQYTLYVCVLYMYNVLDSKTRMCVMTMVCVCVGVFVWVIFP